MSDNPFKPPANPNQKPGEYYQVPSSRSMVSHVPIISVLFIVQGVLLLVMSIAMVGYAFFFANLESFLPPEAQEEMMRELGPMQGMITAMIAVPAGGLFILCVMHFVSAWFGFQYRHRVFAMVTMLMGLAASLTCYCAPTAFGLAVYGLIVYLRPEVAAAFQMRKDGMSKEEMLGRIP